VSIDGSDGCRDRVRTPDQQPSRHDPDRTGASTRSGTAHMRYDSRVHRSASLAVAVLAIGVVFGACGGSERSAQKAPTTIEAVCGVPDPGVVAIDGTRQITVVLREPGEPAIRRFLTRWDPVADRGARMRRLGVTGLGAFDCDRPSVDVFVEASASRSTLGELAQALRADPDVVSVEGL
jgi:hypothetical protein